MTIGNHPSGTRFPRPFTFTDQRKAQLTYEMYQALDSPNHNQGRVIVVARTKAEAAKHLTRAGMPAEARDLSQPWQRNSSEVIHRMGGGVEASEGAVFVWARYAFGKRYVLMFRPGFEGRSDFEVAGRWDTELGNRYLLTLIHKSQGGY